MNELHGVPDTLFIPLAARIRISRRLPDFFRDEAALALSSVVPAALARPASEYGDLASVSRYQAFDAIARDFVRRRGEPAEHDSERTADADTEPGPVNPCAIVNLGVGLETMSSRLADLDARFYEVDLPEVIEARACLLPPGPNEHLIGADAFDPSWMNEVDAAGPVLVTASGLFQYFRSEQVIALLRALGERLPGSEIVFDATNSAGLRFANRYVKRSGNDAAPILFAVDDADFFARECGARLIASRPFFTRARRELAGRVSLTTRILMVGADRLGRVNIIHMTLGA